MFEQLPTEDDLLKLSLRGMVCYAVRCAMCVVDLTEPQAELHKKALNCIEVAILYCLHYTHDAIYAGAAYEARSYANANAGILSYHVDATLIAAFAADTAYAAARTDARDTNIAKYIYNNTVPFDAPYRPRCRFSLW